MINWLKQKYLDWKYSNDHNPAGWSAFLWAIRYWWELRPRSSKCGAGCGVSIWKSGDTIISYCSKECAYYGPGKWVSLSEEEIPF